MTAALLSTTAVGKTFGSPAGALARAAQRVRLATAPRTVRAVDEVSLDIVEGEVLGLVGESGCGKSTFGRIAAGILEPSSGRVEFDGRPLVHRGAGNVHLGVQMVFQNPYASLNPRLRVDRIVSEAAVFHGRVRASAAAAYAAELLAQVGLDGSYARRYPHEFSGGQRQRIAIARALALEPRLLICDEAVSALDVSVQAQILNLFLDLRETRRLTYLFISHNLSVVEYLADRVAIMYLGRVVELAPARTLFAAPNHPYTAALIADAPRMDARPAEHKPIQGELPSPLNPPGGCTFHPRCPHATARCAAEVPRLKPVATGHLSACHLNGA
jgi:peptide/nickel transport system ATP-binding protein